VQVKRLSTQAFLIIGSSVFTASVPALDWDDYTPYSLEKIIADYEPLTESGETLLVPGIPIRVLAIWTGQYRPISQAHRQLLKQWFYSYMPDGEEYRVFRNEVRIREGGRAYWIPIQEALLPGWRKDASPNKPLMLFVVWVGTFNDNWVFILNRFATAEMKVAIEYRARTDGHLFLARRGSAQLPAR
jgi:hypothetical protein